MWAKQLDVWPVRFMKRLPKKIKNHIFWSWPRVQNSKFVINQNTWSHKIPLWMSALSFKINSKCYLIHSTLNTKQHLKGMLSSSSFFAFWVSLSPLASLFYASACEFTISYKGDPAFLVLRSYSPSSFSYGLFSQIFFPHLVAKCKIKIEPRLARKI